MIDGKRAGFIFRSPTNPDMYQSCFAEPLARHDQRILFEAAVGDTSTVQGCKPECRWTIAGGIERASFETMTVTPSLDGSAGGLWHGHITGGQIVGGIPNR